jgi:hypothetical protein
MNFETFYRNLLNSKEKLYCRMENLSSLEWCLISLDKEQDIPEIYRFINEGDLFYTLEQIEYDGNETTYILLSPSREIFTIRKEELKSIIYNSTEKENVKKIVGKTTKSLLKIFATLYQSIQTYLKRTAILI